MLMIGGMKIIYHNKKFLNDKNIDYFYSNVFLYRRIKKIYKI